jgi:hypothetical protein
MMNVTRKSVLTGKTRTRNIPVKKEDLAMYEAGYTSMNETMGYLSPQDKEFIMVGITPNEWSNAFSPELQKIVNDKFGV